MRTTLFSFFLLLASPLSFAAAERIISLSPHTTELAYAAGLGDKLVAASDYSDYPEAAKQLERVANYRGIKLERIIALKPDLILAWQGGNPSREMARLEQLGYKVYYSNPKTLDDIATSLENLSQYAADPSIAERAANQFRQQLNEMQAKYHHQRPVGYFYQLSDSPIITVADNSWPSQVFTLCGGRNIFAESPAAYPQVSVEQVILRQPEVIFGTAHATADPHRWTQWQDELPSVANGHLYTLTSDWLNRPTPRTINAVREVCQYLDSVREATQ